ncbi:protein pelota homolog [Oenanthe melanoleuca]|nr:protein pelota homolog [Oenanthe melanoleuca]
MVLEDFRSLDNRCEAREGKNERGGDPLPVRQQPTPELAAPGSSAAASSPPPSHRPGVFLPQDAPPGSPRAAPRACAVAAQGAPRRRPGWERGLCACAVDAARARWDRRRALREGRACVCPSVRPSVRLGVCGPAGSSPQPSLPGQTCCPLPPRHGGGGGAARGAARMKLVRKDLEKDNAGQVTLIPEEPEDMWHTYNLLQVGDSLRASTIRKVQTESSTGSVGSNRIRTTLTLCVETIDFDSQACQLRVKGTNIQENEYVKMGAYHTIELEPNRQFTLAKKQWDSVVLERIEQACDPAWSADVAAVVMQEGLAHVCLVTPSMTLTRAKVEVNIPRKRKGNCSQHDRALERFYEQVVQAIQRHINFEVVKCVLVASPGFVREQFCDYMFQQAVKTDNKLLLENRSKFLQVHSSSGHKYALKEALCDPAVTSRLSDTKAAGEVKALDDFYKMLQHEPDRAFYGLKHVEKANEAMAIDTLLISDELFRHQDVATRARYVKLVDSVRENMGTVRIFSSLHVSGEQLGQLTGVAAILRFPVAELSDQEDESSSEED